ncbi:MAG: RQC domain-containing protein, partial [Luteolibacter sp.]
EDNASACGSCDSCKEAGAGDARALNAEEILVVRKALSGVARMSRRNPDGTWQARFGRGRIVQMLLGSKSQEVIQSGLHRLTTYSILSDRSAGFLNRLMRSLHDAGLLQTVTGEYPLVTLTELGERAMRGDARYQLVWPEADSAKNVPALQDHGHDDRLHAALRKIRNRLASNENVQPYRILTNKSLEALVRYRPRNADEAMLIPGVGEAKIQRYMAPFLAEIRDASRAL